MNSRSILSNDQSPTDAPTGLSSTARRTAVAVAATVGAAAVATTLAAPADAASKYKVWDRVAHCESTNNWDINTGNGFYGGLQFTNSTWKANGGHKYAKRADKASRLEQIEVARRVLDSQGPGAWPVCGPNAGLTRKSGDATSAKLPAKAGTSTSRTAAKASHKAKHRSTADAHPKKAHHSKHTAHGTYKVHSGDTLASIAHKKDVKGGWKALYKANKSHVKNPNVIRVGQTLQLP